MNFSTILGIQIRSTSSIANLCVAFSGTSFFVAKKGTKKAPKPQPISPIRPKPGLRGLPSKPFKALLPIIGFASIYRGLVWAIPFLFHIVFVLFPPPLSAQNELELVRIGYSINRNAGIEHERFPVLDTAQLHVREIELLLQYGHPIAKSKWEASYQLNYQQFKQHLFDPGVLENPLLGTIHPAYYQTPAFSQMGLTTGVGRTFKKGWATFTGLTLSLTDDFRGDWFSRQFTWAVLAYVEKEHSEGFSFGAGAFINRLGNRFFYSPIVNLRLQNKRRGLLLSFPNNLNLWQKAGKNGYFEGNASLSSFSLTYNPHSRVQSADVFWIKAGLGYSYIWEQFLKFSVGVDMPMGFYEMQTKTDEFGYSLGNSLGLRFGISLVLTE